MFRRGGLLFEDFNPSTCSPCNQIKIYDWANVHDGDQIVIFDEILTAEGGGQYRTVVGEPVPGPPNSGYSTVTLNVQPTGYFHATDNDGLAPPKPIFANGHSGGVGVLGLCDSDPNQINGINSCFYDGDIRDIEQPYNDAHTEFYGLRSGNNAVPLLATAFFDWAPADTLSRFSAIWFAHFQAGGGSPPQSTPHNYFHAIGANQATTFDGKAWSPNDWAFVMVQNIINHGNDPWQVDLEVETDFFHEFAHLWLVNPDTCDQHDERQAWCGGDVSSDCGTEKCIMNVSGDRTNFTMRFCEQDLLKGAASGGSQHCGDPPPDGWDINWNQGDGAIRTRPDPQ
jgi:hypothetical protein